MIISNFYRVCKSVGIFRIIIASLLFLIILLGIFWGQPETSVQARPLLATQPTIGTSIPSEVMVGEAFTFEITLGPNASTTGYGPIIDVVFPVVGAGADPLNPNGFDFVSATYLGSAIECASVEFALQSGTIQADHPYAKDSSGSNFVVTHNIAGDKLVSCQLPFGSYVPGQPNATILFNAKQLGPPDPAVGIALPIYARGGFMFGEDPLDNWCCDYVEPTLTHGNSVPSWPSGGVTPVVIKTNKTFTPSVGSEYETATGPNYVNTYTITVDVADGKTVNSVQITDTLDNRVQFVSVTSVSSGSCGTTPSTTIPGGTLVCDLGNITGGSGSNDASVTFSFYIPDKDSNGSDILTPGGGGCDGLIPNNITVTGTAAAGAQSVSDTDTGDHEFYACAIASQKSNTIINDVAPSGISPGDTVKYTINFQVSDYFAFDKDDPATTTTYEGLIIEDALSDGQRYDGAFVPQMSINGNGYSLAALAMTHGFAGSTPPNNIATEGNFIITCNYTGAATPYPQCDIIGSTTDGTTDIDFYVSDEIIDRGQNGQLVGGCVPPVGLGTVGGIPPDYELNCDPGNNGYDNDATTGEITFQAIVQDAYSDACGASNDCSLDQGDIIRNEERPTAYVLNNNDLSSTLNSTTDTTSITSVTLTLNRGTSQKEIYAVDGVTTLSSPLHVSAGDVITYKLKLNLSTSDFEDLYFTDYLPLPVLDVDDPKADGSAANWPLKVTSQCAAGASPAAGDICFSSADTFYAYSSVQPDVTYSSASNSLKINYGNYDNPANQAKVIELLFSIAVNTQPFTDGLKLTNQAAVHEGSTQGNTSDSSAIINFILDEPVLVNKKSVIATDNTNATMAPAISGYTFTAPESSGKRWTSPATIDSPHLNNNAINSNINGSDGGDMVTFAIVIENQSQAVGSGGGAYDITIKDTLPTQLQIPAVASGLNLVIYLGDGTGPITYTKPDGTPAVPADLFGSGIKLDDPGAGLCQAHAVGPGKSVIIVTYDLQIKPTVSPGAVITNGGTITNYSNKEGGEDFTGPGGSGKEGDLEDQARITISDPAISKSIKSTSNADTGSGQHDPALDDLIMGEEVTFEIVVTLPEGNSTGVTITDDLPTSPAGVLSVQSSCVTSVGANLTLTNNPTGTCPTSFGTHNNTDADTYNDQVVFDFGDITNTVDGVEDDKDRIVLQVVAIVEGHDANEDGDTLTNNVAAQTGSNTQTGSVQFEIVEPDLDILDDKTDGVDYFAPGGLLIYQITYENVGTAPATGTVISDTVPANATFDEANSTAGWVLAGTTNPCPDNAIQGTVCEYNIGKVINGAAAQTINFAVEVDNPLDVSVTQIVNTATIRDDQPIDDSDPSNDSSTDTDERAGLGKSIQDTNQAFTANPDVAIGELITYRVVISIPAHDAGGGIWNGIMPNLTITDDLDEGLAFVDCLSVTASSANLTTDLPGGFAAACSPDTVNPQSGNPAIYPIPQTGAGSTDAVNQGRRIVFNFSDVTNVSTTQETITIDYRVAVLDSANNIRSVLLNNNAESKWQQNGTTNSLVAIAPNVQIREPEFALTKTGDRTLAHPGTTITFTLFVEHTGLSDTNGYEAILTDYVPDGLSYIAGTLQVTNGRAADTIDDSDSERLRVIWDAFPLGETSQVQFQAVLGDIGAGNSVSNTANLEWTSLPGDFINPPNAPQSSFNTLSTERWYDPASPVDIYGVSATWVITVPANNLPGTGFAPGQPSVSPIPPEAKEYQILDNLVLDIPKLGISVPIVGVPLTESGWDLTWLTNRAGYLDGTAYPTWLGNTVLTAHAYLSNGEPGPFAYLEQLGWGDFFTLTHANLTYVYEVRERSYVEPDDLAPLRSELQDWVTLITCSHYDDDIGDYRWRVIVRAVLLEIRVK